MFEETEVTKGILVYYYLGILDRLKITHPPWKEIIQDSDSLDVWYERAGKFRWPEDMPCPECGRKE